MCRHLNRLNPKHLDVKRGKMWTKVLSTIVMGSCLRPAKRGQYLRLSGLSRAWTPGSFLGERND
jgi:hypothetical protein